MQMIRGIKHPDGYCLHDYPGRPSHDHIAPLQD
jgi:hypothetical protein